MLQCVSGPNVLMLVRSFLSYGHLSNLRTYAIDCNRELQAKWLAEWLPRFSNGELPLNVLLLDFVTNCPELVHAVVECNVSLHLPLSPLAWRAA